MNYIQVNGVLDTCQKEQSKEKWKLRSGTERMRNGNGNSHGVDDGCRSNDLPLLACSEKRTSAGIGIEVRSTSGPLSEVSPGLCYIKKGKVLLLS